MLHEEFVSHLIFALSQRPCRRPHAVRPVLVQVSVHPDEYVMCEQVALEYAARFARARLRAAPGLGKIDPTRYTICGTSFETNSITRTRGHVVRGGQEGCWRGK